GNGDARLDIGETATYTVTLVNLTEGPARGVTAKLVPADPGVSVLDSVAAFGDVGARAQVAGDAFEVRNDSSAVPRFRLTVSDPYGPSFDQVVDFAPPTAPANVIGEGSVSKI